MNLKNDRTYSIYHLFKDIILKQNTLHTSENLESFPFNEELLACHNRGIFPDMAIRLSTAEKELCGGELIEIKDSKSYMIPSFNSTIPTGFKFIKDVAPENSRTLKQMREKGDDVYSKDKREVFYLIRGRKKGKVKVCLIHGSFFETVSVQDNIKRSFEMALDEAQENRNTRMSRKLFNKLGNILDRQKIFSSVRKVEGSAVSLRFRVMAEARPESNILNSKYYPTITDNSLNLLVPYHSSAEEQNLRRLITRILSNSCVPKFLIVKHLFNGPFFVTQLRFRGI